MRFSTVLLMCLLLSACGRTGALFLPDEPPEPAQQEEQQQSQDTNSSEQAN